jgi:plastocyanin
MSRIRLALAVPTVALAAAVAAGWATAATPTLKGTVGPGFTITLSKKSVKAGTYKIVVSDKSNIHNFHLTGAGVNKTTSVAKLGTSTWTVKLKKGTYKFVCDPHASIMKGTLKVT